MHRITGKAWEAVPEQQGADNTAEFCQQSMVAIVWDCLHADGCCWLAIQLWHGRKQTFGAVAGVAGERVQRLQPKTRDCRGHTIAAKATGNKAELPDRVFASERALCLFLLLGRR